MDLHLNEEQKLLKESAARFLRDQYAFDRRKLLIADDAPSGVWSKLVDLGWLGAWLPEEAGGLGGSAVEFAILMEEAGRHLYVGPYLSASIASALLRNADSRGARERLAASAEGERHLTVAHLEPGSRGMMDSPTVRGIAVGSSYRLTGRKRLVYSGCFADETIVSAVTPDGPSFFAVPMGGTGVATRHYRTVDNDWVSDVEFDLAEAELLVGAPGYASALDDAIYVALLGVGAEAIGLCEAVLTQTKDYLADRKQFGRSLIEFQALQHRISDLFVETETLRWSLLDALSQSSSARTLRARSIFGLKIQAGSIATMVAGQCLHLHGGMGMTDEMPVSHYYRRARMIEAQFGNTDYFTAAYTTLMD
ncbi:acyl-CoA dehydrogenase family protein [Bradyrhizobium sp. AS23.2]|uniref:acyl-CoA dehydrogenase family protein n=1 Tax=Bradyrhizobium sp. AS23.2 TaxID=1680155 RepID=UPI00093B8A07|nr:acyl-CoA dehydrogenase family protein [Bradyrhizobium sp. AS23.2]